MKKGKSSSNRGKEEPATAAGSPIVRRSPTSGHFVLTSSSPVQQPQQHNSSSPEESEEKNIVLHGVKGSILSEASRKALAQMGIREADVKIVASKDVPAAAVAPENLQALLEHPLLKAAGAFKDDPLWDEFTQNIRRNREELDALAAAASDSPTDDAK